MFDDLNNSSGQIKDNDTTIPSGNRPGTPDTKAVEDIFSDTKMATPGDLTKEKPAVFQLKNEQIKNQETEVDPGRLSNNPKHKFLALIILVTGLAVLSIGGFFAYRWIVGNSGEEVMTTTVNEPEDSSATELEIPEAKVSQPEQSEIRQTEPEGVVSEESVVQEDALKEKITQDSDQDGLTDEEEELLGTDINNVDTDNDNLFDREEVKVYKTYPLNPDTDGDTYLDGTEVKQGYNPKGAGKLYEIK